MKKSTLLFLFLASFLSYKSQKRCGTDEMTKIWLDAHPEYITKQLKMQEETKSASLLNKKPELKSQAAVAYTIPVVFHVLHKGGSENISDAQIQDAINVMNIDFQKKNADTASVITEFQNLIGNAGIEFRLATKDPNGNCTSGITRHYTSGTDWTGDQSEFFITWPSNKYLNVYVVKTINTGSGVNAAGYTFIPGTAPAQMDAIVCLHDYVGSIGTSSPFRSRTLTHEAGHWLSLRHLWGSTNQAAQVCGDDGVADTPITKGFLSCPGGSPAICTSTIVENYQNFMDYSYCTHMFTIDQAARMTATLNASVMGRNNLSSPANLIATGITNPGANCIPLADISMTTFTVCSGATTNFIEYSYNAAVTSRTWSASGSATISAPNATATGISFPTAGVQTISLTVSNVNGSSTVTKTITVIDVTADYGFYTYMESFEGGVIPAKFNVINQTGGTTWKSSTYPASGNFAVYIDGSINPNNAIDILETPSYDFLNSPGAIFTLKYAYARKSSTHNDVFKIQATKNCGGTWEDIFTPNASFLASGSGGTTSAPFFPTPAEYKTYTLTAHPSFGSYKSQPNVRIRFYFQEDAASGFGNNIFLDDINFESPAGINELTKSIAFGLYPNPSNGMTTIDFTLSDNAIVKYEITDIIGRTVETVKPLSLKPGNHTLNINKTNSLAKGVYLVNFDLNGQRISRKLIIE